ncbi:MAG: aminotransferase class IV [Patescibacteria group bacterium]|nr:aminotransferase class IV [Patescibacteria group bacterium]
MKKKSAFLTINGKNANKISVFDHGLLYGDGIYETIRIFNKKAFLLQDHLDRLFFSAKAISLKIPYTRRGLIKIIKSAYKKSKLVDAFVRIIVTRGVGEMGLTAKSKPNVIIIVNDRKFRPLEKINLTVSNVRRVNRSAIDSKIKSLNYLNNVLAKKDALKRKFDDALLLNDQKQLTEATSCNIFLVAKGKIFTPSSDSGILEGIIRKAILENFTVTEKRLTVKDLRAADEVFLSGTVHLITCVQRIDSTKFHTYDTARRVLDTLMLIASKGVEFK